MKIPMDQISVYDIETESIPTAGIDYMRTIWCIGVKIGDTPVKRFTKYYIEGSDGTLQQGLDYINSSPWRSGHNLCKFDDVLVEALVGKLTGIPLDTLLLSKIIFSKDMLYDIDYSLGEDYPSALIGAYSLKAFGLRMGGDAQKLEFEDWSKLSTEMIDYMVGDVEVSAKLINFLMEHPSYPIDSVIEIEHKAAQIIAEQEILGFHLDITMARKLNASLLKTKLKLEHALQKIFRPKMLKDGPIKTYKKLSKIRKFIPDKNYEPLW